MKIFSLIILLYPIISKIPGNELLNFNQVLDNISLTQQKQEFIFKEEGTWPIIIFIFGCFIILFGAYYNFFLIIKFTLFLYYIISIFIKSENIEITDLKRSLLFVLLFSFISGVLLYIGYKSFLKFFEKHYFIKRIIFGAITGCFFTEVIFHYVYTFNDNYEENIYYYILPAFIVIFGGLYILIPENIELVPCSVISGAFFIKSSLDNLLGYSDKKAENIIGLILFIIFIIGTFLYQIYHLKRKKSELPSSVKEVQSTIRQNLDVTVTDERQSVNSSQMLDKTVRDNYKGNEEGDVTMDNNNIDDQDD